MPTLAMSDDAAPRDPGAPIGRDEIDPDLIKLRRAGPTIGTITAAAIVILCVTLLVRLRHDFAFSREDAKPRATTAAEITAGKLAPDSFVTLDAPIDRIGAIRVRTSEATSGNRVVAVRATGDKLWLALPGDPWGPFSHDQQVTGRLRRLDDVRFAGPLAAALVKHPAPRFITGTELQRARAANDTSVTLLDGDKLAITATDQVELSVVDPGAAVVVAALSPGRPDVASWTDALAAAGVIAAGAAPTRTTESLVRWEVHRADAVASIQAALDGAQLWGARVEPSMTHVRAPWTELPVTAAGVGTPDGVIPWSSIDVAGIWARRTIPAGAWVVLADEKPGDYWYLTAIYIGLAVLGLLFTWALARAVRRQFFDKTAIEAAR